MDKNPGSQQIASLRASKLFGRFEHHIIFPESDGVAIITAPNGYGKTVLLRVLDSVFNRKLAFFRSLDFAKIQITFASQKAILISKDNSDLDEIGNKPVEFRCKGFGSRSEKYVLTRSLSPSDHRTIERDLPVEQIGPDRWLDYRSDKTLSTDEVLETYSDQLPDRLADSSRIPTWLQAAIDSVDVHLVETQRLLRLDDLDERRPVRRRRSAPAPVVDRDAADLAARIGILLQRYAQESQKLDQTFPERILKAAEGRVSGDVEIRHALQELSDRREELISVGLLDRTISEPISPSDIRVREDLRRILEIYVEDTGRKLSIFDETYDKIKLFKEILEKRFAFKHMEIDADQGIRAIDRDSGAAIPLSALSSGEQHELVLIYGLLFVVQENALILIDEPELSLHVSWQKRFIDDLQRIQKIRGLRVLIATHSPQIIHKKWNLVQELMG